MDCFHFFEKRSFRFENDVEKTKNETIVFKKYHFLKNIVLVNGCISFKICFKKKSFSKTIIFRLLNVKNDGFLFFIFNNTNRFFEVQMYYTVVLKPKYKY